MNIKAFPLLFRPVMITFALIMCALCVKGQTTTSNTGSELGRAARAVTKSYLSALANNERMTAVITEYEVKDGYRSRFGSCLSEYARHARSNESNIMAELYVDEDNPALFWVIERWTDRTAYSTQQRDAASLSAATMAGKALVKPAQATFVKDLEPLSRTDWNKRGRGSDEQLTIMLFVDARPGTEKQFQDIYHTAMPRFRGEQGVITYQLSQFIADKTKFVTYEKFSDEAAFQYHLNFPPIQPVIEYLNTSIVQQPFQRGLHRLRLFKPARRGQ